MVNEDKKGPVNDDTQQFLESMSKNMLRSRYEVNSLSHDCDAGLEKGFTDLRASRDSVKKANDEMIIIVPSEANGPPEPPTDREPQPCYDPLSDNEEEINPYAETKPAKAFQHIRQPRASYHTLDDSPA